MILIAESGSTKCDAVFLDHSGREISRFRIMGFNPYFHDYTFIREHIKTVDEIAKYGEQTTHVFFYGAGCSTPPLCDIIKEGIAPSFPNAEVMVDHDLKACAYATYDNEPSISCILGTGSNSVFFDGENIRETVPALAFILGDEGSASYIGKRLIRAYLYHRMSDEVAEDFYKTYGLDKDTIIDRVYSKPNANVFLGSLSPFAHKHIKDPFFRDIVYKGFYEFLDIHVKSFPESAHCKVNFVGSIAYHFMDVLEEAIKDHGLKMGQVIRRPLDGLVNYHMHILPKSSKLFKAS